MKIKNRIRAGIVLLALAVSLTACGSSASSTASSVAASATASSVAESTAPEAEPASTESSPLDGISFRADKVRNDTTGNWRISLIAENIDMSEYALDYKQYFTDDSEIHFIVNFNYNTTTKIMVMGGDLDVTVQEYVAKEEHDAKMLGSGTVLAEYFVNSETGEIEKVR